MLENNFTIQGLNDEEVLNSRKRFGANKIESKKESGFLIVLKSLAKEPMILLLLVASLLYFILGDIGDALFMVAAILLVAAISIYQDNRSRKALLKLNEFIQPKNKVIRNGKTMQIDNEDIVVGDMVMIEEGAHIPADGVIVHSNDFSVNESLLTGESLSVYKDSGSEENKVFNGTIVAGGLAIFEVTAIGNNTKLGEIGRSLTEVETEKTPLEKQINAFVKYMVIIGAVVFFIVWIFNYFLSYNFLDSLLKALTLAMSILPEEIPVAFTTFMALGAFRLMKMGIVVKQMKTVETLGSATVICTDKTGTLTENKMRLSKLYTFPAKKITNFEDIQTIEEKQLIEIAMWASEPIAFDPMEISIHQAYKQICETDERVFYKMIHEYPISGKPPMMTHIFENEMGNRIIAAKGAPEAILHISDLTEKEKNEISSAYKKLSSEAFRILAVGSTRFSGNQFPSKQQDFLFTFHGLLGFYDPPKNNINEVLSNFYTAGIKVKIITGDNASTTTAIAKEIGFNSYEKSITGQELLALNDNQLKNEVENKYIFSRTFPEAKLRIIEALKANNEIVAMTGDGVNDGPALKAAHIGIAMGKKGTEIAKGAASLILMDDNLEKMVDAVAMGRKIYTNLKKAIQYIISIHIPIILTVFFPLVLGWVYPNIFTPVHVIFLELIMGPTCSIIYENEPMEKNIMLQKPRPFANTFFNWRELTTSIIQGLMITAGTLFVYQYAVSNGFNEPVTRTMVFTTLISSNIFLTLINRSFHYSIFESLRNKNNLITLIVLATILLTTLLIYVHPLASFFRFQQLKTQQLLISVAVGFVFTFWYEIVKYFNRIKK
ncbi:MAG TPA: cation-translocating P-type ATPase [Niabella sp.]|nr:cation-translocating P-type ATPase [Niabella sp.]